MTGDISTETFADALSRVLGHPVAPSGPDRLTVIVEGTQRLEVTLGETVTITTPLAEAHDGLPPQMCRWLLERNFPGGGTAGAMLIQPPRSDRLALVNHLPSRALGVAGLAALAWNQAQAAMALDAEIAKRVAAHLSAADA